jgi:hypothetical protein
MKNSLLKQFEKKWCKDPDSGFLSPLCHIDDVAELLKEIIGDSIDKDFGIGYVTINEKKYFLENDERVILLNELVAEQRKRAGL